jgi:hypothetical protein
MISPEHFRELGDGLDDVTQELHHLIQRAT